MITVKLNRESDKREPGLKGFLYWWLENERNRKTLYVNTAVNIAISISLYFLYRDLVLPESDPRKQVISLINNYFLSLFVLEYIVRFYIATDFLDDIYKDGGGLLHAIVNKLRWMVRFYSIIDLLSILPVIRYFRVLRFFRLLRFVRLLSWFRNFDRYALALRGMKQSWRVLFLLTAIIMFVSTIVAYGLYYNEADIEGSAFSSYEKSFWYALGRFNIIDVTPSTLTGKVIASFLLFVNLIFVSSFISFMTVNIGNIMNSLKQGKVGISAMNNHIVICGYTSSSKLLVKNLLLKKENFNNIIMVTQRDDPDIKGTLYLYGDFSDEEVLEKANIGNAKVCVIFGEIRDNDSLDNADMRTVLTVFNIEEAYSHVHTIAEIYDPKKAKLVQEKMSGDEVFFKSSISADIINASVNYPYISKMINELLSPTGKHFARKTLHDFGLLPGATFKEIKERSVEQDFIVIGVMCEQETGPPIPELSPTNTFVLSENCTVIVVG